MSSLQCYAVNSNVLSLSRQGHSLAIGALPRSMLKGQLKTVLSGLRTASQITEKQMAEARRDAIIALSK